MFIHPVVVGVVGTLFAEALIFIGLFIWKYSGGPKTDKPKKGKPKN